MKHEPTLLNRGNAVAPNPPGKLTYANWAPPYERLAPKATCAKNSDFMVHPANTGLLIEMLALGAQAYVQLVSLGGFKCAYFKDLMIDTQHEKRLKFYCAPKDPGLEMFFLVHLNTDCVPFEAKARASQVKGAQTILKQIAKFSDNSIGQGSQLLALSSHT